MALIHPYCTEEELREQFDDDGDILPQAALHRAINATSRAIDKFCDRWFWMDETPTTRLYLPGDDPEMAWVDDFTSTDDLVIKTDPHGDGSYSVTWEESDYQLEPVNAPVDGEPWYRIVAVGRYRFPTTGRRTVLQVGTRFGYGPTIPDGVNQSAILKAASLFKRRESVAGVAGFDGFGAVRISRRRDPDVVALLDDFVKIGIGAV